MITNRLNECEQLHINDKLPAAKVRCGLRQIRSRQASRIKSSNRRCESIKADPWIDISKEHVLVDKAPDRRVVVAARMYKRSKDLLAAKTYGSVFYDKWSRSIAGGSGIGITWR
jgi:hypothetical protein